MVSPKKRGCPQGVREEVFIGSNFFISATLGFLGNLGCGKTQLYGRAPWARGHPRPLPLLCGFGPLGPKSRHRVWGN